MLNRLLLGALAIGGTFFCTTTATAQSYKAGFMVEASGDTIRGLVKHREGKSIYKSFFFKKDTNADVTEYSPESVVAYGFTNGSQLERKQLTDKKGNVLTAFAEVLVRGRLNLYQYQNQLYLAKQGEALMPLQKDEQNANSTKHLILINSLTLDCPVPEEHLAKMLNEISTQRMVEVVENYNNCVSPNNSITYNADKPWTTVEKGLSVSTHTATLDFNTGSHSLEQATFSQSQNLVFGAFFNIAFPRTSQRLSLQLEPLYSQEKHQGYAAVQEAQVKHQTDYSIAIKRLAIVSMGRYQLAQLAAFTPYLGVGLTSNIILSGQAIARIETESMINDTRHIETSITDEFLDSNLKKLYLVPTVAVGTGYQISDKHTMQFQIRYDLSQLSPGNKKDTSRSSTQLNSNNSIYLTAAYIFR